MKRKMLIIANPNSIWTKTYIENVLANEPFEVFLLGYGEISKDFLLFYKTSGVHFVFGSGSTNKVRRLIEILKVKFVIKPDFIQVMFVTINACKMADLMMRKGCKLILSYMGSDIFRLSTGDAQEITPFLERAYSVTLPSEKAVRRFDEMYSENSIRVYDAEFGDTVLDYLDLLDICNRNTYRRELDIDDDTFVIHIGYNGSRGQNHIGVLKQISKLDKEVKDRIFIVCHVSYGVTSADYIEALKMTAKEIGCRYSIYDKFLNYEDMAKFRMSADCFVNAQETDDYSVSLLEYLYVGCPVINANWLKYERLEKSGIKYSGFDDYSEIPRLLMELMANTYSLRSERMRHSMCNKTAISIMYSWKHCRSQWLDIYDDKGIEFGER